MKIGYVQKRSGLISESDQIKELLNYGVDHGKVYSAVDQGLEETINSCRTGDTLVVWSAAVIGTHAYAKTITALADNGADLHVLRKNLDIPCKQSVPAADGLKDIKHAEAAHGKKHGRKLSITPEKAQRIEDYINVEGFTQAQTAEHFTVSTRAVSYIMNGTYFANQKKGKKK